MRPCGSGTAPDTLGSQVMHVVDREGWAAERYDLLPGTVYLLRPDQHVCARWRQPSTDAVHRAVARAMALH